MRSSWQALWSVWTVKRQRREQRTAMVSLFNKINPLSKPPQSNSPTSSPPDSDSQNKVARIRHETQIHMLNLLITSLDLKTPNLALYLLGYEVKKPVSSTNLQDPGESPGPVGRPGIFWMFLCSPFSWLCVCFVLQVCWDAPAAACTPSWVCCREARRRDRDLYSHSKHHTWLSSATKYFTL